MLSPDSVVGTLADDAAAIVSISEAQAWVGVPPDAGTPAGLDLIVAAAQNLVDGPDGDTGYCFRRHRVVATVRGLWPSYSAPVLLPPPLDPSTLQVTYTSLTGAANPLPGDCYEHWVEDGRDLVRLNSQPQDYDGRWLTLSYDTRGESPPPEIKVAILAIVMTLFSHPTSILGPDAGQARDNPEIRRILDQLRVSRQVV